MKRRIFRQLLFFSLLFSLSGETYYISDGLGTPIRPVAVIQGNEPWFLRVESEGNLELRTLYHNQNEWKRWEILTLDNGETWESYFFKKNIQEILVYSQERQLLSEKLFNTEGTLLEHRNFSYHHNGAVKEILFLSDSGEPEQTSILLYRDDGSLRGILRQDGAGEKTGESLWHSADHSGVSATLLSQGDKTYLYSYENWHLTVQSFFLEDQEVQKSFIQYDPSGRKESETRWYYRDNSMIYSLFDESGRVLQENSYISGLLKLAITREYRDNQLVRYLERNERDKILWEYRYESDPDEPVESTQYRNGQLVKRVLRLEDADREIIYRDNQPVYEKLVPREEGEDS